MGSKPLCYLCDLDGTLCDVSHRRQWVATKPKNWAAWNAGISEDGVNEPVHRVIQSLSSSYDIVLVSGREDTYRVQTVNWLRDKGVRFTELYMRKGGDYRSDDIVKSEILDRIRLEYDIIGVFDDRKRVVDMWIEKGIFVFDVGQGNADF